jgi:hypothetical protein
VDSIVCDVLPDNGRMHDPVMAMNAQSHTGVKDNFVPNEIVT